MNDYKYNPDLFRGVGEIKYYTDKLEDAPLYTEGMPNNIECCRYRLMFKNGYGASIVRHGFSYGGPKGLFELAILDEDGLCYDTPITSDVIGHLTSSEVGPLLKKISELPPT